MSSKKANPCPERRS